jgi:hypothetical protein
MFFASKIGCSGIVFLLLTTWISGPRPTPLASGVTLGRETPAPTHWNDVKEMQQTLQGAGHYQGKLDGVLGLRTRASIRGYQKAESLPVTGQLDVQTAGKLGVKPEVRETTGPETQDKPSAGIRWPRGSRRTNKTLRKAVETAAAPEIGWPDRKPLQVEDGNHPQ